MTKESILIFNPKIARSLIKKGYQVIDIKPFKENTDKTIFIFKRSQEILREIQE